jgi:hypothetical protein
LDNKESTCHVCLQAKAHQLLYPVSSSHASSPLELIFSDVWDLVIDSFGGKKYYVSFIDDFSKFTWIYLLHRKSEVFKYFHEFQQLVERMFSRKIVAMHIDWGDEYDKLNPFFRSVGISRLVSCPHTHQQNDAAEHKYCHIVEMGLALFATATMLLKYWDQAFLVATYLINHTPTKLLDFDTPIHHLLGATLDYTSLRVFGCACWLNLCPYNKHKLQFQSTRCVFVGYSSMHKGFKCLDISFGHVYIYRDVVFDETCYPFAELKSNAGACYTSEILLLPDSTSPRNITELPPINMANPANPLQVVFPFVDTTLSQTIPASGSASTTSALGSRSKNDSPLHL